MNRDFTEIDCKTFLIKDKHYLSVTFSISDSDNIPCTVDLSLPIEYIGRCYVWTNDDANKRIWADLISILNNISNPNTIFYFLANRYDLIEEDDLIEIQDAFEI